MVKLLLRVMDVTLLKLWLRVIRRFSQARRHRIHERGAFAVPVDQGTDCQGEDRLRGRLRYSYEIPTVGMTADSFTKSTWGEQLEIFVNIGWLYLKFKRETEPYLRTSVVSTKLSVAERS